MLKAFRADITGRWDWDKDVSWKRLVKRADALVNVKGEEGE